MRKLKMKITDNAGDRNLGIIGIFLCGRPVLGMPSLCPKCSSNVDVIYVMGTRFHFCFWQI